VKVLVTGGAGFIGSHISDALLEAGHEVVVFDDLSTGHRENVAEGAVFVQGDLRDADAVERVVSEHGIEAISHQGAQTSVSKSVREPLLDAESNVLGTLHLLRAAVTHGVRRLVFASTGGAIYGEVPEEQRATTEWLPAPLSPYACSKLAGEAYLRAFAKEHGIAGTVLRYANVYGPRQDPHGEAGVVAIFAKRILQSEPLRINAMREPGDDGCVRDYVFVTDVVRANLAAIEGAHEGETLNVATGEPTTTRRIADGLVAALGADPSIDTGPRREGDLERSVLEPSIRDVVPLSEGLTRTARWFADQAGE